MQSRRLIPVDTSVRRDLRMQTIRRPGTERSAADPRCAPTPVKHGHHQQTGQGGLSPGRLGTYHPVMIVIRRRSAAGRILVALLVVASVALLAAAAVAAVWWFRPNAANVSADLAIQSREPVASRDRNWNPSLAIHNNQLFLAYATTGDGGTRRSPALAIETSDDGERWRRVAVLSPAPRWSGQIRLASAGGQLVIYSISAADDSEPAGNAGAQTVSVSSDGVHWREAEVSPAGLKILQSPVTSGQHEWYAAATSGGSLMLARSTDGIEWAMVSDIAAGLVERTGAVVSAAVTTLPGGRLLALVTCEVETGTSETFIAVSRAPFREWGEWQVTDVDLSEPALVSTESQVYALDHTTVPTGFIDDIAGLATGGRAILYEVDESSVSYLSDFPASGEVSRLSLASDAGFVFSAYQSGRIDRDPPPFMARAVRPRIVVTSVPMGNLLMRSLAGDR